MSEWDGESPDGSTRLDRREFVRSAMLVGGAGAVSALGGLAGCTTDADDDGEDVLGIEGEDRVGVAERRNRQHSWDDYERKVGTGNTAQPHRSLVLQLDYAGDGEPTADHRRRVERALREIERHFEWSTEGVLFTMAYSASYFDRFDADPPVGARPTPADRVVEHTDDLTPYDPEGEAHDAVLLLSGDHARKLLAVESALWGGDVDVEFAATFEGVFEKPDTWPERRVGFAGTELPKERYDEAFDAPIPDDSPLSMGFVAGFGASIPHEDAVTLQEGQVFPAPGVDENDVPTDLPYVGDVGERDPGVFAQGTLKHLSYLTIDLTGDDETGWYDLDRERRRHQIYSPYHTREESAAPNGADKPGAGLTDDPGGDPGAETADDTAAPDLPARRADDEDYANRVVETATQGTTLTDGEPTAGHSQKAARARYDVDGDGELEQPCLRRDWDGIRPAVDGYEKAAGYHFNVPMRFNESIFTLLDANYSAGFRSLDGRIDHEEVDGPASLATDGGRSGERNGLVPFMDATRRANYLVPPITMRALPVPRAREVTVDDLQVDGDRVRLVLADATDLDPEAVRVGEPTAVNQARGAAPVASERRDGGVAITVARAEVPEDGRVKLFGLTTDREPVVASFSV